MKRAIWSLALITGILWSLFAWGAYALVGWLGELIAANAHWVTDHADALSWLSWASGLLTSLGLAGVVVIWVIGVAMIGLATMAFTVIVRRARQAHDARISAGPFHHEGRTSESFLRRWRPPHSGDEAGNGFHEAIRPGPAPRRDPGAGPSRHS